MQVADGCPKEASREAIPLSLATSSPGGWLVMFWGWVHKEGGL